MSDLKYQSGFGNHCATEALPGALPQGRNSPQVCPYGLYAEQLSGTAFTVARAENRRSWLYRIRPTALQGAFEPYAGVTGWTNTFGSGPVTPNRLRWNPLDIPTEPTDFLQGMHTWAGNGHCDDQVGVSINLYAANQSMKNRIFYNADAEMMFVPQQGRLRLATELGLMDVSPLEIAVIPRGVRFRVELPDAAARGYVLENFGAPMRLPELGPIGSNGMANARDFEIPVAWYEDVEGEHELIAKFTGGFWRTVLQHSPLDVVAWHGTHAPYKYDLRKYNAIGSISYDHPDPCIFTVLTSPSDTPGAANMDFAIFPPRILAMENTFRPPWFHRNIAGEFMGLIHGEYDAKAEGFTPGGASLHNCMSPHGPDAGTFEKASTADLSQPTYIRDTMAFMFETRRVIRPTDAALSSKTLQSNYDAAWSGLKKHFNPNKP
ncbi:homogentisate 1,2-dioxygenase [Parapusillimonas granuli]|uniref:Homogentisate 1,2-dioxygenase n=1 Tax=Parapusillimonas granuli TaxID=380911 RepID=A0A853G4R3_9BURK|nr:homogentisate 1,2-dioxygenase [Parapusillimonas granuli]MBB5215239.1 homogentisate 1,2-dioxygenase [Parapusillimonas granuli]NYT49556.1 homogentisate 1,2-dioxygenase [Parapusillimonas granuli]